MNDKTRQKGRCIEEMIKRKLWVLLTLIALAGVAFGQAIPVLDIDPSGKLGPGNPIDAGQVDRDPKHGGIYIAKEPDDRWHVVGAGILPWGGTQIEMVASAINIGGKPGKITPEGEFTIGNPGNVFDSPEGGQIDWIKIEGNKIQWLTWFNGTGAWDGTWFKVEGDYLVFETLGMNNEKTGAAGSGCGKPGDRKCLIQDPLPPAPKERIFIGGDKPDNWKNPPTEAPFALRNNPKAPLKILDVELTGKLPTIWGAVKESSKAGR